MQLMDKLLIGGILMGGLLSASVTMADDEQVFGWVEKATLQPWDIEVKAKLDSGALTSSLDARNIELLKKMTKSGCAFV